MLHCWSASRTSDCRFNVVPLSYVTDGLPCFPHLSVWPLTSCKDDAADAAGMAMASAITDTTAVIPAR
ncbi:hypothetical protein XF35_21075 [Streptomyces platensis subsp. clarensis]|nr:hypothetical protein [Streptomyces platensis subsp. clarensis]